jgi:hypothetical protein
VTTIYYQNVFVPYYIIQKWHLLVCYVCVTTI